MACGGGCGCTGGCGGATPAARSGMPGAVTPGEAGLESAEGPAPARDAGAGGDSAASGGTAPPASDATTQRPPCSCFCVPLFWYFVAPEGVSSLFDHVFAEPMRELRAAPGSNAFLDFVQPEPPDEHTMAVERAPTGYHPVPPFDEEASSPGVLAPYPAPPGTGGAWGTTGIGSADDWLRPGVGFNAIPTLTATGFQLPSRTEPGWGGSRFSAPLSAPSAPPWGFAHGRSDARGPGMSYSTAESAADQATPGGPNTPTGSPLPAPPGPDIPAPGAPVGIGSLAPVAAPGSPAGKRASSHVGAPVSVGPLSAGHGEFSAVPSAESAGAAARSPSIGSGGGGRPSVLRSPAVAVLVIPPDGPPLGVPPATHAPTAVSPPHAMRALRRVDEMLGVEHPVRPGTGDGYPLATFELQQGGSVIVPTSSEASNDEVEVRPREHLAATADTPSSTQFKATDHGSDPRAASHGVTGPSVGLERAASIGKGKGPGLSSLIASYNQFRDADQLARAMAGPLQAAKEQFLLAVAGAMSLPHQGVNVPGSPDVDPKKARDDLYMAQVDAAHAEAAADAAAQAAADGEAIALAASGDGSYTRLWEAVDRAKEYVENRTADNPNYPSLLKADAAFGASFGARYSLNGTKSELHGIKGAGLRSPNTPEGKAYKDAKGAVNAAEAAAKEARTAAKARIPQVGDAISGAVSGFIFAT